RAAARILEPAADDLLVDDHQRRRMIDMEAVEEVGARLVVDEPDREGRVVVSPLQNLREVTLCPAATPTLRRGEEHEHRSARRRSIVLEVWERRSRKGLHAPSIIASPCAFGTRESGARPYRE